MRDTGMSEGEYQAICDMESLAVWKTRDGREIPVSDMDDAHLVNTIRFLRERSHRYKMRELHRMARYIWDAPDGAADACALEAMHMQDMPPDDYLASRFPAFGTILAVAERRGLKI